LYCSGNGSSGEGSNEGGNANGSDDDNKGTTTHARTQGQRTLVAFIKVPFCASTPLRVCRGLCAKKTQLNPHKAGLSSSCYDSISDCGASICTGNGTSKAPAVSGDTGVRPAAEPKAGQAHERAAAQTRPHQEMLLHSGSAQVRRRRVPCFCVEEDLFIPTVQLHIIQNDTRVA
jgi:hypothetical protein